MFWWGPSSWFRASTFSLCLHMVEGVISFTFYLFCLCSILHYFHPLFTLGFLPTFCCSLICKLRLLIWDLSCFFLMQAFIAINFPLSTAFSMFRKFWYVVFSFFSNYFLFPLCPLLRSTCCFKMYYLIYTNLWILQFSFCYWSLISSPMWSEKIMYGYYLLRSIEAYFVA